jgi:4-aminobutyrate aminotransferase-like enzyme
MALANIAELRAKKLVPRSARLGAGLLRELQTLAGRKFSVRTSARGLGLMAALELQKADGSPATEASLRAIKKLLHRGFIFLPEGEHANIISFTPPLTITEVQLRRAVQALASVLQDE